MSLKTKTMNETIEWINASNLGAGKKKHIVKTIQEGEFSGADLADVKSVDDLRDMGFSYTSKSLLELINSAAIQSKQSETEKIKAKVRAQFAKQKKNEVADESKLFSIKYKYGGKSHMTKNKFSMNTKVSEFIYVLAHGELGIDPTKTTVLFLSDQWTDQVHKTLGEYKFSPIIECVVSFKVRGGMAALANDEKSEGRERYPDWNYGSFEPTMDMDSLLFVKDDNLRIKMSCGHVFGPQCVYEIINMCAEDTSKTGVACPMDKCGKKWDFKMLIAAADLNEAEISRFSTIFTNRVINKSVDTRECKSCANIIQRPENLLYTRVRCTAKGCKSGDFCWVCGESWQGGGFTVCGNKGCVMERINDILAKCEEKVLVKQSANYTKTCPVFRACPRCATLVEYDTACKHMRCWGCNKQFCFYCLGLQKDDNSWPCQGYGYQCEPAPRQKFK